MYHYVGSGLRDVWLANGYAAHQTPYGESVAIEDVLGLHRAIGDSIVNNPKRVSGAEFRFLRKEQELSQKMLAELIGTSEQTLARWETGKNRVPVTADRVIRVLYQQYNHQDGKMREMVDRLNSLEDKLHTRLNLTRRNGEWTEIEQVAA